MKNTKNVVYTFSSELDIIKNIENINNDILGNITKIKTIRMNSIESESELEKNINEFFNSLTLSFISTVKVVLEPPPPVGSRQFFLRGGGYITT